MQLSIQSRSRLKDRGSLVLHQSSLILKEFAEEQGAGVICTHLTVHREWGKGRMEGGWGGNQLRLGDKYASQKFFGSMRKDVKEETEGGQGQMLLSYADGNNVRFTSSLAAI